MKRTYKEAVEITVKWWSEKAFKTPFNQNNGDNSPQGSAMFMLINSLSISAQDKTTKENIEKFEQKLTESLLKAEGKGRYENELSVDYDPNRILFEACEFSGASAHCLPIKTFTFINKDNEIEGRYQYGGDYFKL